MTLPSLLSPQRSGPTLTTWLERHRDDIRDLLRTEGAVLVRGFAVLPPGGFREAAAVVLGPLMDYVEGASPRSAVGDGVYTSTEYAADQVIALHNELSYSTRWPATLAFYCRRAAGSGGQTPLADSRRIYARVVAGCAAAAPTAVRYLRHMHEGKGAGVGWPTVFADDDPAAVESYCRTHDIDFTWLGDGTLRTSQVRPAAIVHPVTGERVWFNQAHQWHPSNGGPDLEALWREIYGDDLPMDARLPDGGDLEPHVLDTIRAAYHAERRQFDWQPGDLLFLDNMLTAHGRAAFTGQREVLVAMGGPTLLADVEQVGHHG
ncbi:TauD/TfdA family dioxygenase [Nonomuraea sp. NPDC004297]